MRRELQNEERHVSSPNDVTIIKQRNMGWAGRVEGMVEKRNAYRLSVGKPE